MNNSEKIGPKEAALRAMRENRNAKNKGPSASDLRKRIAKVNISAKNPTKRRGR